MPNEYQEQWDEYNQTHQKAESAKGSHDFVSKLPVEASREGLAKRKEQLATIQNFYNSMKSRENQIVDQAKSFAYQSNPDNIQMYLDAYTEYFDYLASQPGVADDQINALVQNIDALEGLIRDQKVRQDTEQQVPEDIRKTYGPADLEQIRALFVGIVTQEIAHLGLVPENGFSPEKIREFWQRAAALYNNNQRDETGEDRIKTPRTRLIGAVRKILANPGWTGHAKY